MDDEYVTFHVMTLTGKIITIKAPPSIFVKDIKSILLDRGCAPPDKQRLIYAGKELTDEATLEESVGIMLHKEPRLHLVLRLRGMISTWTTSSASSDADLGNMFLLDPEGRPPPPLDFLIKNILLCPIPSILINYMKNTGFLAHCSADAAWSFLISFGRT
jgi:hypothetical protein